MPDSNVNNHSESSENPDRKLMTKKGILILGELSFLTLTAAGIASGDVVLAAAGIIGVGQSEVIFHPFGSNTESDNEK